MPKKLFKCPTCDSTRFVIVYVGIEGRMRIECIKCGNCIKVTNESEIL